MNVKTVGDLNKLKESVRTRMAIDGDLIQRKVAIGMATCGLAAGAQPVMDQIIDELDLRCVRNVEVYKTGCIGICKLEPIVEVYDEDMVRTTYVCVDKEKAKKIVVDHLINGQVCHDYVIGNHIDKES